MVAWSYVNKYLGGVFFLVDNVDNSLKVMHNGGVNYDKNGQIQTF